MTISVIIPALNEEAHVVTCLQALPSAREGVDVIVIDGGSSDRTREYARSLGATVLQSQPGRGTQLNAGARIAKGDLLLFLHADTLLPPDAFDTLRSAFEDARLNIGCFRSRFAGEGVLLRCYSFFTRFESVFTSFGDQGIVVRKDFYRLLGGFPDWLLFEDVEFLRLARKQTAIRKFQAEALTSGRRFTANGALRQQLRNFFLLMQFLGGRSPNELAGKYPRQGTYPEKCSPGIPVPSTNDKGPISAGHITETTAPRRCISLTNTETPQ